MPIKSSDSFRGKNGVVDKLIKIFDRRNSSELLVKPAEVRKRMVTETEDDQEQNLNKVFKIFDKNGEGHFNKNQLMDIMHSFGLHVRSNEIDLLLQEVNMDADGNINFKEFVNLFEDIENEKTEFENDLRKTFSIFDKKNTGYISTVDLGVILNNFGLNLTDVELKEMIAEADADKDELISFYDLMMLLCSEDNEDNISNYDDNESCSIQT